MAKEEIKWVFRHCRSQKGGTACSQSVIVIHIVFIQLADPRSSTGSSFTKMAQVVQRVRVHVQPKMRRKILREPPSGSPGANASPIKLGHCQHTMPTSSEISELPSMHPTAFHLVLRRSLNRLSASHVIIASCLFCSFPVGAFNPPCDQNRGPKDNNRAPLNT